MDDLPNETAAETGENLKVHDMGCQNVKVTYVDGNPVLVLQKEGSRCGLSTASMMIP